MRFNLHHVHINKLSIWDRIARHNVPDIYNTVSFFIRIVVKENMLGLVVSLIYEQKFTESLIKVGSLIGEEIFGYRDRGVFLKHFHHSQVDLVEIFKYNVLFILNFVDLVSMLLADVVTALYKDRLIDLFAFSVDSCTLFFR